MLHRVEFSSRRGKKDNIRRRVGHFARLARRAEIQGMKKKRKKMRTCRGLRGSGGAAYRVAVAIKERNADDHPRAHCLIRVSLIKRSNRACYVSCMKILSDESRDEKPPKEFLRRKASLLVIHNQKWRRHQKMTRRRWSSFSCKNRPKYSLQIYYPLPLLY